jgi:protein involved in polysaccharide export with SLBB domain
MHILIRNARRLLVFCFCAPVLTGLPGHSLAQTQAAAPAAPTASSESPSSPLRLRQPADQANALETFGTPPPVVAPRRPGEFESYVGLSRFGTELVNEFASNASDSSPAIPPDYIIQSGDEVLVTIWGSVDADLRLIVDRSGRVTIPRVGPVQVAGLSYSNLEIAISRRLGQVFKNFQVSTGLGRLRGVRVYVTGFVQRPGAYSVAALSTVLNVVMRAGGPSAAGSFRQVELRRQGSVVASFDLYALLLSGDRSSDRVVRPDDVIHVAAVGTQVAVSGSVNKAAVFEVKPTETLKDLLTMTGGFSPVADKTRVALERIDDRQTRRMVQLELPESLGTALTNGDVVRVFSAVEATLSSQLQNKRIRVDGEVSKPGEYVLPPGSTLSDALRAAGGLTPLAYLHGTQFTRQSVQLTQQENYDRALRDLETDFARSSSAQRVSSGEQAVQRESQLAATSRLVERLRALKPSGRVVLQWPTPNGELPALALEDGDRLYIPPRPTTVGVFGSVFNAGSYLFGNERTLGDYIRLAGGPTQGADEGSVFVVRASGQVVSVRQSASGFWRRTNDFATIAAEPGDTIFVPEETDKTTFVQAAKDWTQILYQFGLGIAGIVAVTR